MRLAAIQRDDALRAVFAYEVSIHTADMFIFLDETGTDRRDVEGTPIQLEREASSSSHKLIL